VEAQRGGGHLHELLGHAAVTPPAEVCVAAGELFVACLAGVLGDVRRDLSGIQLAAVFGAGQDAGVQLLAETNVGCLAVAGITVQSGTDGGLTDRVAQLLRRDIDAGRGRAVVGAIQADDGVEVHQPAGLELGDLRVRDADPVRHSRSLSPARAARTLASSMMKRFHSAGACQFHSTAPCPAPASSAKPGRRSVASASRYAFGGRRVTACAPSRSASDQHRSQEARSNLSAMTSPTVSGPLTVGDDPVNATG